MVLSPEPSQVQRSLLPLSEEQRANPEAGICLGFRVWGFGGLGVWGFGGLGV